VTTRLAIALVLLAGSLAAGCGGREPSALAPYASGTLTPGQGLDDIRLGDPVRTFVERFGAGQVAVTAGDEQLSADLHFPAEGLSFRFDADPACRSALAGGGSTVRSLMGLREPAKFLASFPACATMRLQSIGVAVRDAGSTPAFTGMTAKGTRLQMTRAELFEREGAGLGHTSASSVLDSADEDRYERFFFPGGLIAYVQKDGAKADEPAAAQWKVVKMAVIGGDR
jgi:hypothetical protein